MPARSRIISDSVLSTLADSQRGETLIKFSQGATMARQVGLRRKTQVAGVLGYSGMLTGAGDLAGQPITNPPFLLIHGSADTIVPV